VLLLRTISATVLATARDSTAASTGDRADPGPAWGAGSWNPSSSKMLRQIQARSRILGLIIANDAVTLKRKGWFWKCFDTCVGR